MNYFDLGRRVRSLAMPGVGAVDASMGGFGKAVEQGNEGAGVGFKVLFEGLVVEIEKELHVLAGNGGGHFGAKVPGSGASGQLLKDLFADAGVVAALAGQEPVLVTALAPAFEVMVGEMFAGLAEFGDDGVVSESIEQEEVEGFAEVFGQAGDFAVAGSAGAPGGVREDMARHRRKC